MPRTKGTVNRDFSAITLDTLATSMIADPKEVADLAPKARGLVAQERTPVMKQFDQWAQEMYDGWVKAGKPAAFTNDYPPRKVFVANEDQARDIHTLIVKSAQFTDHGVRFGQDTDTTDGQKCVSYCIVDKIVRTRKAKS